LARNRLSENLPWQRRLTITALRTPMDCCTSAGQNHTARVMTQCAAAASRFSRTLSLFVETVVHPTSSPYPSKKRRFEAQTLAKTVSHAANWKNASADHDR